MFRRDELLGGLPARRASTILVAIEGATARLLAASRINRAAFIGERTSAERERAFLHALSSGAELPRPPPITDLERFAPGWAHLVPDAPEVRAAIARLLGKKHRFRWVDVPRLRAALGLDDPAVANAFVGLHGQELDSVFVGDLAPRLRLRWLLSRIAARFDRLSPFWIAYFLALTETLGEGILAVPLALAGLGPVPGVVLLLVLGAINLITMGALTEAVIRNGSMRYGAAYFTRLVSDLLGRLPASGLSLALGLFNVLTFFVYLLGFGSVLTGATGVPMAIWIGGLFVVNVIILRKETLDDTIASAVLIGTVNLLLVVLITGVALLNVDPVNLGYANVPIFNGRPLDSLTVGLVFGIVLTAFFGHTSAANASKLVLTLEPSGRSLLWGNLAALATIIVLYCAATIAFLGVLGPEPLVGARGTAITPLGNAVGPIIHVLGSLYVVLAIGIGSLYVTMGLYNQVIELLPRPNATARGLLARVGATRRGRLVIGFAPAAAVCVALEVVVLTGQDSFAGPLGIGGALAVPVITGVFPMLLILAARRKGEYVPGRIIALVGHPAVVAVVTGLFVGAVALHGLVIWDGPAERLAAIVIALATLVLVAWSWRNGAFRPRAVIELRRDGRTQRSTLSVTAAGHSVAHEVPLDGLAAVTATADLPAGAWREVRVWPHEVSADGWSTSLDAEVEVNGLGATPGSDPRLFPHDGTAATVQIRLAEASRV